MDAIIAACKEANRIIYQHYLDNTLGKYKSSVA